MELVEKMTRCPTDLPWEQTLTGLNRFTLDDDKDEA